jgi:hypothetical protein
MLAICLGVPASSSAAPRKPITGRLDTPGYTVIALTADGRATTVRASDGRFRLTPADARVTLHLRAPGGGYAGPIVLEGISVAQARAAVAKARKAVAAATRAQANARTRSAARRLSSARARLKAAEASLRAAQKRAADRKHWAVVWVRAGAPLGKIRVRTAAGVAVARGLSDSVWTSSVIATRRIQATAGVPVGAGTTGFVRSARSDGAAGGDRDRDGVPDVIDVDDDGDLVLDDYDTSSTARAAQTVQAAQAGGAFPDGSHVHVTTGLGAEFTADVTNANSGSTAAQIATGQQHAGHLNLSWTGFDPGTAELDCGTLVYCTAGGTGRFTPNAGRQFTRADAAPFPECCDADHDGLGTLTPGGPGATGVPGGGTMAMYHGATSDQLHTGDVVIARGTVNGTVTESASSIGFVYATFPVVAAFDDGQGHSATFTYPRDPAAAQSPVRTGPDGDVVLRLTLWRPQRPRTAGDPGTGTWMDVGNLAYIVAVGGSSTQPDCPQRSFSALDGNLRALTSSPAPQIDLGAGGFADVGGDRPADPANTLSFTLNLSDCLRSKGMTMPSGGMSIGVTAIATGRDEARFFTSSWFAVRSSP